MTRPARVALRGLLAAGAASLALAGCTPAPEYPVVAPTGTVAQPGGTWTRWIEVDVESASAHTVTLAGARIVSPMFAQVEAVSVDQELPAGESATLRLPLGIAECPPGMGETSVQLSLVSEGVELLQTVMLDPAAFEPLNAGQCEGQVVGDAVAPSFGTVAAAEAGAVATELVLVRGDSNDPVEILAIDGTRAFDVEVEDGALPLTMMSTQAKVAVPVTIRTGACESLTPAQAAGVMSFSVDVRVGGGGEQTLSVAPQGSIRAELEDMLASCGE